MGYRTNFPMHIKSLKSLEKTNYYNNFFFSTEIPDLIDIQRKSFQYFIEHGFKIAFDKTNPLIFSNANHQIEITFFPEWIQFRKPEFTLTQAIRLGKTYGSSVYIPIAIKSTSSSTFQLEWLLLGFLPIMTKKGHFLINGIPRVVLHQMTRNPGVYTIPRDSRTRVPTIRIVPEQGSWINLTLDKKNRIWLTTRLLRRKVSILIFLQALGLSLSEIWQRLEYAELLEKSFIKELKSYEKSRHDSILIRAGLNRHPLSQEEAWRYLYAHFQEYTSQARDENITTETAREFFWKTLWNPKNINLGKTGRQQFQKKLGSNLPLDQHLLAADDLLLATQALLKLVFTERLADDIDSLTNKRIRGCGDFLQDELVKGLKEFEIVLNRKLSNSPQNDIESIWRFNKSILSKCVSKSWKSFFTSGTLSQFMDETNPLAEVTHKRRVTVLGPGGVNSKQTTIQIRGIHPTYYGRLCPIETPEGQNAGLVNSFTVLTLKDLYGNLKTPFYQVYKGQVQKSLSPLSVSPQQEYLHVLAPADILVTQWNLLPKIKIPVRKDWKFDYDFSTRITTQSVGILQMISVATSLIPFLEHDDANRALMGSNMQRQAVPLIRPQVPIVGTGLETRVISDVNHIIQASQSGYITSLSSTKIKTVKPNQKNFKKSFFSNSLKNFSKKTNSILFWSKNSFSIKKFSNFDKTLFLSVDSVKVKTNKFSPIINKEKLKKQESFYELLDLVSNKKLSPFSTPTIEKNYFLNIYQRTNQSTCIFERATLKEGNWVEKGDILADGAASSSGKLALGKNVLVAYIPWEGYNFEDAILISERLVNKDIFTSLHLDYYEIEVKNTQYGLELITNQIPIKIDDSSKDISRIQKLNNKGLIEIGTWVQEGDYLVGKVSPLSPKGPSVQQQYEKLYNVIMQRENTNFRNTSLRVPKGVEGFVLDVQILPPKEADVIALAQKNSILRVRVVLLQRRKIQVGDKMAGRHGNKGVISKILPITDMPYLPDGTPVDIVLNPLGVPSRMNVGQILECLLGLAGHYLRENYTINLFDEKFGAESSRSFVYSKLYEASIKTTNPWLFEPHHPGKIKLFDGRTGLPFDQPITVGFAYMLKLVHLVDDKIHARATGPYSAVTQQPVRGRSRNGGQRLGEMEVWALQAYGAAYTLQELLTIKSDDVDGRKDAVFRIYTNKPLSFGQPESFKVLVRELQALCFNLQIHGIDFKSGESKSLTLKKLEKLL
jgi:DNA-directed RNA polymerase subunit beta